MSSRFDGRGLKCPLGFVRAKQQLRLGTTKEYLLDDEMTLYNFTNYLAKQKIVFQVIKQGNAALVQICTNDDKKG